MCARLAPLSAAAETSDSGIEKRMFWNEKKEVRDKGHDNADNSSQVRKELI